MIAGGKESFGDYDIKEILKQVDERDILYHYMNISEVPALIKSPLRLDKHPSFGIYQNKDTGEVWYKDYATGDRGTLYHLLQHVLNLSYLQVIERIGKDLEDIKKLRVPNSVTRDRIAGFKPSMGEGTSVGGHTKLQCKIREWRKYDLDFWETFGISLPWLKFGNIYPISHIFLTKNNGQTFKISADKYAYAYVEFKDGIQSLKIYQPFSEDYKWTNAHSSSVWDLWNKLPETGEDLIITSSRKDALCIWENTLIPSVSLQAESYFPKENVVKQLKDRFTNVHLLYDNDFNGKENWGQISGMKMAELFGLHNICIPSELQTKDTSDVAKRYGRKKVTEIINILINKKS